MKLAIAALVALLATPVAALDLTNMTDEERAAFGAEVRAYLLANPHVLIEVQQELESRAADAQVANDAQLVQTNAADIFHDTHSYVAGNPEGDLTVVEFIDYRCGYCRKAHSEVAELVKSDGNIRYVVKEFPILGEESVLASRFAIAALGVAGPDAYARINAGFYESFRGDVTPATLQSFATELGLDAATIMARMDSPEVTDVIAQNHLLAQRLQINGTPTFVLGDKMLRGYAPLETMRSMVAAERG
jgi:protein-disulfide isomerase